MIPAVAAGGAVGGPVGLAASGLATLISKVWGGGIPNGYKTWEDYFNAYRASQRDPATGLPVMMKQEMSRIQAPEGTPTELLAPDPVSGLPKWMTGRLQTALNFTEATKNVGNVWDDFFKKLPTGFDSSWIWNLLAAPWTKVGWIEGSQNGEYSAQQGQTQEPEPERPKLEDQPGVEQPTGEKPPDAPRDPTTGEPIETPDINIWRDMPWLIPGIGAGIWGIWGPGLSGNNPSNPGSPVYTPDEGVPTFSQDVTGVMPKDIPPVTAPGGVELPAPPFVVPPPPTVMQPPTPEFPGPPGTPGTPPPAEQATPDPSKVKPTDVISSLGQMLGGLKGGGGISLPGMNQAPVVGGGNVQSLFQLPSPIATRVPTLLEILARGGLK